MQSLETKPLLVDISHITLRLTHEEFEQLCQDNPEIQFELTATGELVTVAPAGWESSERNGALTIEVGIWNRQAKLGRVLDSSGGFTLPSGPIRSPDVTWIEKSKLEHVSAKIAFPSIVPDFVILFQRGYANELRSMTDNLKTLQAKMLEYQTNGVRLGWLINPQQQPLGATHIWAGDPTSAEEAV